MRCHSTPCIARVITRRGMAARWDPETNSGQPWRRVQRPAGRAASWGNNRLDIFAIGGNRPCTILYGLALTWTPSPSGWENLGGALSNSPPAVASWGNNRLDTASGLHAANSHASQGVDVTPRRPWQTGWDALGGEFDGAPAGRVVGKRPPQGLGNDNAMSHKAWNGAHLAPVANRLGTLFQATEFPARVFEIPGRRLMGGE